MKVVALVSGGKDSTYAIMQCVAAGHEIVALANIQPYKRGELDSYMYQTVAHEGVELLGEAYGLPLFRHITTGQARQTECDYEPTENDEVEDLYTLLSNIKKEIEYDAVSVGAIFSDYQRIRVENVCSRLRLTSLAYLWRRDQTEMLTEMISCDVNAMIVKVAALGLEPTHHLGMCISIIKSHLLRMKDKFGLNVCGEGGEYETFTLDCPLYKNSILVEKSETILHTQDKIAQVGYLQFKQLRLKPKQVPDSFIDRIKGKNIRGIESFIDDINVREQIGRSDSVDDACADQVPADIPRYRTLANNLHCDERHFFSGKQSKDGWLWIGGVEGDADSIDVAMKVCLQKLKNCLDEFSYKIQDVCAVTLYVSDMSAYAAINHAYCEMFNFINPPARVCVQCPLARDRPILLDALAFRKPTRTKSPDADGDVDDISDETGFNDRKTMHVQSVSHWAPANIGPYSQAVRIGDIVRIAGQIGLIPGNLQLINGFIKQCRLSLRHVERIVQGVDAHMQLRNVVQGVCYVTHPSYVAPARKEWEKCTNNAIVDYLVVNELPKGALVEWHFWAHKYNNSFEYSETKKRLDESDYFISIIRRWNYGNRVAAIVCHLEPCETASADEFSNESIFHDYIKYAIAKINQDYCDASTCAQPLCNVRVFYPITKRIDVDMLHASMFALRDTLNFVYTIIPVCALCKPRALLSVCGVRYE